MNKTELICSTCGQVFKKNEIHDCTKSIDKTNKYLIDKKIKPSFLNFLKLK